MNIKKLTAIFFIQLMLVLPISFSMTLTDVKVSLKGTNYAQINWNTDQASDSAVDYGTNNASMTERLQDSERVTNHSMMLTGLAAGTRYYFAVSSTGDETRIENNSNQFFTFTTDAVDTTPPFIELTLPEYVRSEAVNIQGRTEPFARLTLYINNVVQNIATADKEGRFSWLGKQLSRFASNLIKIDAEDTAGNKNSKTFNVTVDIVSPEINTDLIQRTLNTTELKIIGNVSELSNIEIFLGNESVLKQQALNFDISKPVQEGTNTLRIIAVDKAGNSAEKTLNILVATKPPKISDIKPAANSLFYQGSAKTTLEGDTDPFAAVRVYIHSFGTADVAADEVPDYVTIADSTGHFVIDNFNLEKQISYQECAKQCEAQFPNSDDIAIYQTCIKNCQEEIVNPQDERKLEVIITATGPTQLTTKQKLTYRLGTCWSGQIDWNIQSMVQYQTPSRLSPERIASGMEFIKFYLKFDYQGRGTNYSLNTGRTVVKTVSPSASMKTDPQYNLSIRLLPSSPYPTPRFNDDEKSPIMEIRFPLNKMSGLNEIPKDVWKALGRQVVFPLKVTVFYQHNVDGKMQETSQTRCINIAYNLDTSRIDMRNVLPDWLLNDGVEKLNETITKLNKAIKATQSVLKYAQVACGIGFGVRMIATIVRRFQEHAAWAASTVLVPAAGTTPAVRQCPRPGKYNLKLEKGETYQQAYDKAKENNKLLQDDLTNTELKEFCPLAAAAWENEAKAYTAYRWACDRLLCKSAPARYTSEQGATREKILAKISSEVRNTKTYATVEQFLKEVTNNEECRKNNCQTTGICYKTADGKYYTKTDRTVANSDPTQYVLAPCGFGKELNVNAKNNIPYIPAESGTCANACKSGKLEKKWANGQCVQVLDVGTITWNLEDKSGTVIKKDNAPVSGFDVPHTILRTSGLCDKDKLCFCTDITSQADYDKKVGAKNPPPDAKKGDNLQWNYRYDKLGYYYDPLKYYEGRDQSACFGQNNWIDSKSPSINPRDTIGAFQCLCISQIYNRLRSIQQILTKLMGCLIQVKKSGSGSVGICKELFTQYLCRWIYKALTFAMGKKEIPWSGKDDATGARIGEGFGAIFGGIQETTESVMEDYDNPGLGQYLQVGEKGVSEKVCMGALTGDWGIDFKGLGDYLSNQPMNTDVYALPNERQYLTSNPENDFASYEYRTGWFIMPGCNIDSYTVSAVCVTSTDMAYPNVHCEKPRGPSSAPNGCDCSPQYASKTINQNAPGPSEVLPQGKGGPLMQGAAEEGDGLAVFEKNYRYDHFKIQINVNDPNVAKLCIPEANRLGQTSGVFYFPIDDTTTGDMFACNFDQSTGEFKCGGSKMLWNTKGKAWFDDVNCGLFESCEGKIFYRDQNIVINNISMSVQGDKKQCLYYEVKNPITNVVLNSGYQELIYDPEKPDEARRISIENLPVLQRNIESADFGATTPATYKLIDYGNQQIVAYNAQINPVLIPSTDTAGIVQGDAYWIYFKDSTPGDSIGDMIAWKKAGSESSAPEPPALDSTDAKTFTKLETTGNLIGSSGRGMKFTFVPMMKEGYGLKADSFKNNQYTVYKIAFEPAVKTTTTQSQTWNIRLQLLHAPGDDGLGNCNDLTQAEGGKDKYAFKISGRETDKTLKIKVKNINKGDSVECIYKDGFTPNTLSCDCNNDDALVPITQQEFITGRSNDCDGKELQYCYTEKTGTDAGKIFCHKSPVCKLGSNNAICDCNFDGTADKDITETQASEAIWGTQTSTAGDKCSYCYTDGKCRSYPQIKVFEENPTKKKNILSGAWYYEVIKGEPEEDIKEYYVYYQTYKYGIIMFLFKPGEDGRRELIAGLPLEDNDALKLLEEDITKGDTKLIDASGSIGTARVLTANELDQIKTNLNTHKTLYEEILAPNLLQDIPAKIEQLKADIEKEVRESPVKYASVIWSKLKGDSEYRQLIKYLKVKIEDSSLGLSPEQKTEFKKQLDAAEKALAGEPTSATATAAGSATAGTTTTPSTITGAYTYNQVNNQLRFTDYQLCGEQYKPGGEALTNYRITGYHFATREQGQAWKKVDDRYIGDQKATKGQSRYQRINNCYPEESRFCLKSEYFIEVLGNSLPTAAELKKQFCVVKDKGFFEDVMCQGSGIDATKTQLIKYSYLKIDPNKEDKNGDATTIQELFIKTKYQKLNYNYPATASATDKNFYVPKGTVALNKAVVDTGNVDGLKRGDVIYIDHPKDEYKCCYRITDAGGGVEEKQLDIFKGLESWQVTSPTTDDFTVKVYKGCKVPTTTGP